MFQRATKQRSRLRLALLGIAGSGKTYTALSIAKHLGESIAVIDTEHGSASKYADEVASFDVVELQSFHPQRYIDAIHAADAAGYDVLIIDSLSHAWNGKDGVLELVDRTAKRSGNGNKFNAWADATPVQQKLIETILSCRMHVICTMRLKTEYVVEKNEQGKQVPRKVGLAPVQRDGLEYEFDVVADLDADNNLIVTKTRCSALHGTITNRAGEEIAQTLLDWLNQGQPRAESEPIEEPELAARPHHQAKRDAPRYRVQHCRGCKAKIAFVSTEKGKSTPMDVDDDGNLTDVSHWSTCPVSDQFRYAQQQQRRTSAAENDTVFDDAA